MLQRESRTLLAVSEQPTPVTLIGLPDSLQMKLPGERDVDERLRRARVDQEWKRAAVDDNARERERLAVLRLEDHDRDRRLGLVGTSTDGRESPPGEGHQEKRTDHPCHKNQATHPSSLR